MCRGIPVYAWADKINGDYECEHRSDHVASQCGGPVGRPSVAARRGGQVGRAGGRLTPSISTRASPIEIYIMSDHDDGIRTRITEDP